MLQPVQVLLAVVEVVLEGAVAVVAEVTLPHGHPRQVLLLPGKSQGAGSERRGNATTLPEHARGPGLRHVRKALLTHTSSYELRNSP